MRSHSKTVIAALVERRFARQERRVARRFVGRDTAFSSTDGLFDPQSAHLLVHSRF